MYLYNLFNKFIGLGSGVPHMLSYDNKDSVAFALSDATLQRSFESVQYILLYRICTIYVYIYIYICDYIESVQYIGYNDTICMTHEKTTLQRAAALNVQYCY